MIVYGERKRTEDPRALVAGLLAAVTTPRPDLTGALIAAGVLEAAVADALCPDRDDAPPEAAALGAVTLDLAHAARLGPDGAGAPLAAAARRLREVGPLPAAVDVSEPEGFAFYALYPEAYAEAARRFARAARPRRALCVGLRSIGATLAAVVAAALEAEGVTARVLTLRPRGHPFERELTLGPRVQRALAEAAGGHVLVVDEGPGISGSSIACAAEAASRAGAPDDRIVLFPSWDCDGAGLRSPRARERWARHPRWTVGFEELFVDTGRLAAPWGGGTVRDLSGGLWRGEFFEDADAPAAQPQHERRKYLLRPGGDPPVLLKFAGLGARGEAALARGRAQAEAGLAPPVLGLADGFLALAFLPGRPARGPDAALRDATARHLAFLARTEPPAGAARFEEVLAMVRLNVAEGLGEAAVGLTAWMDRARDAVLARPAVAGDGRMLPHEWLRTDGAILKCDGLDHHADHFFPRTQDVAWDLAGAAVEFGLDAGGEEALTAAFVARTSDNGVRGVLPFYRAAYLAWRLGYAALAAETLGGSADGARMAGLRDRYAAALRRVLAAGAAA